MSIEVEPGLAHDAAGTIAQAQQLWAKVASPNAMIKIPATVEGLEAITEATAARHQRQRHLDLQPRTAPPSHRGLPGRARAGPGRRHRPVHDPLGRLLLRLAGRHRDRQASRPRSAPTRRSRSRATRASPTRSSPTSCSSSSSRPSAPRHCSPLGAQHAAPALGIDRRQGPGLPGHPLRHRARRRRRREHHAREDPRGDLRPRAAARRCGHRLVRRGTRGARRAGRGRHRLRRRDHGCSRTRASTSSSSPGTNCSIP